LSVKLKHEEKIRKRRLPQSCDYNFALLLEAQRERCPTLEKKNLPARKKRESNSKRKGNREEGGPLPKNEKTAMAKRSDPKLEGSTSIARNRQ